MQHGNWLYEHRTNITSQHGEDGVIEQIFKRIGAHSSWVVDIGAGDGKFLSNSWTWINNDSWSGVCVEANPHFYSKLDVAYQNRADVFTFNEFATFDNGLDDILSKTDIPINFDLLSIDIDSIDYHIWKNCIKYRPRVVVIEINASVDYDIELVQEISDVNIGSSALSMVKLAESKGYELVAHLVSNCIFVVKEEFLKLDIEDNYLESLFTSPFVPKVVSDLNGVHYLIKEGPWGVREFKIANDLQAEILPKEDGYLSVERALTKLTLEGELVTNSSKLFGHSSQVNFHWDVRKVLESFKSRMLAYKVK